jgi:hypothetical protein
VPRVLQLVALVLAFTVSGAPAWLSELAEDECGEKCAENCGCSVKSCRDCSIVCSACPRSHVLVPSLVATGVEVIDFAWISSEASERVPEDPVPEGIFHPPRLVAG